MRLDMDCIRDVLLEFETLPLDCHTPYSFPASITQHGEDAVCYSLAKLSEGDYINADVRRHPGGQYDFLGIYDMTFSGHELLAEIRDPERWKKVKSGMSAVRSYSLSAISAIAEGMTAAGISALFQRRINP